MKKIVVLLAATLIAAAGMFTGCKKDHEHGWASAWSKDEVGHWHDCDGCDEDSGYAEHTGGEATCAQKASCEVCGGEYGALLAHDYSVLQSDGENHWYECVCGAKDEETVSAHTGGVATCTQQAVCESCNTAYGNCLPHDYDYLITDGEDYFYKCGCGAQKKADPTLEDVVEALVKAKSFVKAGTTTYKSGTSGKWNEGEISDYEYRKDYVVVTNRYSEYVDYFMLKANGQPFSVREDSEGVQRNPEEYSAKNVEGFRFNPIIIDSIMDFYGAEALVYNLYEEALYDDNKDLVESLSIKDGKIAGGFSFGYYDKAGRYLFKISVQFTLGEEGFLETVAVRSDKYTSRQYSELANGTAQPKDSVANAFYNYSITVEQTSECETYLEENPYDPAVVLLTSFDLVDDNGNVLEDGSTITVEAGAAQTKYYIKNSMPENTIYQLNPFGCTLDGSALDFFDTRLMVYYITEGYIGIRPLTEIGEFELGLSLGDVTKTVTYNIILATPTAISPTVYSENSYAIAKTADTYVGMKVHFNAAANAVYCDPSFYAELTGDNAADASLIKDADSGDFVFRSMKVGTYSIKLISTRNEKVTTILTVNVQELPDVAAILSGEYQYVMGEGDDQTVVYDVSFTPDTSASGVAGQVQIVWVGQGTVLYDYTFTAEDGLVLVRAGGANLSVKIGLSHTFALYIDKDGVQYPLTLPVPDENQDLTKDHPLYAYMKIFSGMHRQGVEMISGGFFANAIVTFYPDKVEGDALVGRLTFEDPNTEYKDACGYTFTKEEGLTLDVAVFRDGGVEYRIYLNDNNKIVVLRQNATSMDNSYTFICEQVESDPDAYVREGSETPAGGESGVTLQGAGTDFSPYILTDDCQASWTATTIEANVFQYSAEVDGTFSFTGLSNAMVFMGTKNELNGGMKWDTLPTENLSNLTMTARQKYYFMIYAVEDGAVSFAFSIQAANNAGEGAKA